MGEFMNGLASEARDDGQCRSFKITDFFPLSSRSWGEMKFVVDDSMFLSSSFVRWYDPDILNVRL